jgi:molybdate transport repressor ModE-like protein
MGGKVKFRIWIEKQEGEPILSLGKYLLLKEIEKTGSIKEAAKNLGYPYKKAHSYVKLIEKRLGKPIFVRKRGEGTVLTDAGRELLKKYEILLQRFEELARKLEGELFENL